MSADASARLCQQLRHAKSSECGDHVSKFSSVSVQKGSSDIFPAEQAVHNCHTFVFGRRIEQKCATLLSLNEQTSAPLQNAGCTMESIILRLDCSMRKIVKYTRFLCYLR